MEPRNQRPQFTYPTHQKELALSLLCQHYKGNPQFMTELSALAKQNETGLLLLYYLMLSDADLGRLASWWVNEAPHLGVKIFGPGNGFPPFMKEQGILKGAGDFATRWGLTAPWGPPLILKWASTLIHGEKPEQDEPSFPVTFSRSSFLSHMTWEAKREQEFHMRLVWNRLFPRHVARPVPREDSSAVADDDYSELAASLPDTVKLPPSVVILVENYYPTLESRKSFLKRAMAELTQQAADIEDYCREHGMEKQGGKSVLETHVEWLYLAICPDSEKGRALRFREIADGLDYGEGGGPGEDTIRKAVSSLADELRLNLTQKPGRPRA